MPALSRSHHFIYVGSAPGFCSFDQLINLGVRSIGVQIAMFETPQVRSAPVFTGK